MEVNLKNPQARKTKLSHSTRLIEEIGFLTNTSNSPTKKTDVCEIKEIPSGASI
jgi:hypothetical protein